MIQHNGRNSRSAVVQREISIFAEDAAGNLRSLQARLARGRYKFQPARGIRIPKRGADGAKSSKFRPLVLADVGARVVQRAILNVLTDIPAMQPYIDTPMSFGGVRSKKPSPDDPEDERPISAVPAAIKAVLDSIESGSRFYATADISSFFTKIPKSKIIKFLSEKIDDEKFINLLSDAIKVELENIAELRSDAFHFPIEDIGVAQGNSLSPIIGNIYLSEFDRAMNEGDCSCIRYIDDFIILAPTQKAANARLKKAERILKDIGLELAPHKGSSGTKRIDDGIEFLGISIDNGFIRPTQAAEIRIVNNINQQVDISISSMLNSNEITDETKRLSLHKTIQRIDGILYGWAMHYWFCNDGHVLQRLDKCTLREIQRLMDAYFKARRESGIQETFRLLGITRLASLQRQPFTYPRLRTAGGKAAESAAPPSGARSA